MARFKVQDLRSLEKTPTSPATLRNKLGELLISSVNCTARVEGLNMETGEYRVVLQGSLDKEDSKFDES
ncbi:MAG TPA: hypothetical protein VNI57_05430 [Candidatus Saccharimonadales bacterium]|nr:hypothetical protein [Candidatus Saccharimonadales bacterium]